MDEDDETEVVMVVCKFCYESTPEVEAHRHASAYVCEDCWDERLRATE